MPAAGAQQKGGLTAAFVVMVIFLVYFCVGFF